MLFEGADPAQLDQVWKMLDDMAENNPLEYEKLVKSAKTEMKQQHEERKFIPNPGFVAAGILELNETVLTSSSRTSSYCELFVNVCQSENVLRPYRTNLEFVTGPLDLDNATIPVSLGARREDQKGSPMRVIHDVVINPIVFKRCRSDLRFKSFVSLLAIEKVVQSESLRLSPRSVKLREGSLSFPAISYKAGKQPEPHVLSLEADPDWFERQGTMAVGTHASIGSNGSKGEITTGVTLADRDNLPEMRLPQAATAQHAMIEVVDEVEFTELTGMVTFGGRDWSQSVSGMIENGLIVKLSIKVLEDVHIHPDLHVTLAGNVLVIDLFGFEPLQVSLGQDRMLDVESAEVRFSRTAATLTVSFSLV